MTAIMGILNVTPDSFSDGGQFDTVDTAIAQGLALRDAGAAYVDVGGESTRPGAAKVDAAEEQARVIPVIRTLAAEGVAVSVDTMNSATASAAVDAGAVLINDVSGGLADPRMANVVAETGALYAVMHWRGGADAVPEYTDVVADVRTELAARITELTAQGVAAERILVDPGLGFAKKHEHNWQILARLDEISSLGCPVLVGASRKRFVGALLPEGAAMPERDLPSAVISAFAAARDVWGVRVHDVAATRIALDVATRMGAAPPNPAPPAGTETGAADHSRPTGGAP